MFRISKKKSKVEVSALHKIWQKQGHVILKGGFGPNTNLLVILTIWTEGVPRSFLGSVENDFRLKLQYVVWLLGNNKNIHDVLQA